MIMVKHELFIELFIEHNIFRKTSTICMLHFGQSEGYIVEVFLKILCSI